MVNEQLILLRRREIAGTIAVTAWVFGFFLTTLIGRLVYDEGWAMLVFFAAWIATICWMALDARLRGMPAAGWIIFAIFLLPAALAIYLITRPAAPIICSQCGTALAAPGPICPNCGRPMSAINRVFARMTDSLAPGSLERARHTAMYMAIALGAFVLFGILFGRVLRIPDVLGVIAISAYWVLVPWWVYLDATRRRMEPVPWALLTLLTNVFGLVTYLVIRYPDPGACRQCGAYLAIGQKHCPYCGSEAGLICPQCKAPLRAEWAYCPACAMQLSVPVAQPKTEQIPNCVEGIVSDASTGNPISGAEVRVDSKSDGLKAETDASGRYRLENLEPRPYVLVASAKGYEEAAKAYKPGMSEMSFSLKTLPND